MLAPFRKPQNHDSMEFEFFTYADNSILEVRVSGTLEVNYFLEMATVVIDELETRNIKRFIYYNESADPSGISPSDLKKIVKATRRLNRVMEGGRVTAAITNKLSYGLIRMWHAFSALDLTYEFQLFNNHQAAMSWLQRPED